MKTLLQRLNIFFEAVPDKTRQYRFQIVLLFSLLSVIIIAGCPRFKIDMTMESYFKENDPTKIAYDRFRAQFGSDISLVLIYEAKDKDVFSTASLHAIKSLQDEIENYRLKLSPGEYSPLDRITEVSSIINASYIEERGGDIISRQFIGEYIPENDEDREALRKKALDHPDYPLLYISKDTQFGSIIVRTNLGAIEDQEGSSTNGSTTSSSRNGNVSFYDNKIEIEEGDLEFDDTTVVELDTQTPRFHSAEINDFVEFMNEIHKIIDKPEYTEHLIFHPVGTPPIMTYLGGVIMKEMGMIIGLCVLIILVVLAILFRSLSAVVWPLLVVILSLLWIVGLIGWSGFTMTFMINIIVFMVLSVGVSDAIHILSGYLFFRQLDQSHEEALRSVFKKSGLACFLTTITTVIGLLALTIVPIVPVRNFGLFAALGVSLAFIFTIFLMPLMLDIWHPYSNKKVRKNRDKKHPVQTCLKKIEHYSYTYSPFIITLFVLLIGIFLYGISFLRVDSNVISILHPNTEVRKDVELVDKIMGGGQSAEIFIYAHRDDAIKDLRVLNAIEALQGYTLATYPDRISLANSIVNSTKLIYKSLNENREDMYLIPQEQRILEQTLFMFNNANPDDRRKLVSDNYRSARIGLTLKNDGSYNYVPIFKDIQAKADELFMPLKAYYPELEVSVTGNMSLMLQLADYISWSQINSFGVATIVISLLLLLVFGSVMIGATSILPNIFPIFTALGLMGFMDLQLDIDTLLVVPIIIGISVDDTIHFLIHYRAGIHQYRHVETAIKMSIREAGQAICFTSMTLAFGFMTFILSSHNGMINFGLISAIAITAAMLADLLFLPALCALFKVGLRQSVKVNGQLITINK